MFTIFSEKATGKVLRSAKTVTIISIGTAQNFWAKSAFERILNFYHPKVCVLAKTESKLSERQKTFKVLTSFRLGFKMKNFLRDVSLFD